MTTLALTLIALSWAALFVFAIALCAANSRGGAR